MVWAPSIPIVNHLVLHHGAVAMELLEGPSLGLLDYQSPAYYGGSTLVCALLAGIYTLLGPPELAACLLAITFPLATLLLLWALCRQHLGRVAAVLACAVYVLPPWEMLRIRLILYGAREQSPVFLRGVALLLLGAGLLARALPWFVYNATHDWHGLYIHGEPLWQAFALNSDRWLNYDGDASGGGLPRYPSKLWLFFTKNIRGSLEIAPTWLVGTIDFVRPAGREQLRNWLLPEGLATALHHLALLGALGWLWFAAVRDARRALREGRGPTEALLTPERLPLRFLAVFMLLYVLVFSTSNFMHDGYFAMIFPVLWVGAGAAAGEALAWQRGGRWRWVVRGIAALAAAVLLVQGATSLRNMVLWPSIRNPTQVQAWDRGVMAFQIFRQPWGAMKRKPLTDFEAFAERFPEDRQLEIWPGWGSYALKARQGGNTASIAHLPEEHQRAVWEGQGYAMACANLRPERRAEKLALAPEGARSALVRGMTTHWSARRLGVREPVEQLFAAYRAVANPDAEEKDRLRQAAREGEALGLTRPPVFGLVVDHLRPGRDAVPEHEKDPSLAVPPGSNQDRPRPAWRPGI